MPLNSESRKSMRSNKSDKTPSFYYQYHQRLSDYKHLTFGNSPEYKTFDPLTRPQSTH